MPVCFVLIVASLIISSVFIREQAVTGFLPLSSGKADAVEIVWPSHISSCVQHREGLR